MPDLMTEPCSLLFAYSNFEGHFVLNNGKVEVTFNLVSKVRFVKVFSSTRTSRHGIVEMYLLKGIDVNARSNTNIANTNIKHKHLVRHATHYYSVTPSTRYIVELYRY
jgi:hypothetical protein